MREIQESSKATLRNIVMEELTFNGAATAERIAALYDAPLSNVCRVIDLLASEGQVQVGPDGRVMAVRNG